MSESGAFHFAVRGAAALAPAVLVGILAGPWLALAAAILGVAAAVVWTSLHRRHRPQIRSAPPHLGAADERRILVVANDVLGDDRLPDIVRGLGGGGRTRVLVLAPLTLSTARRWASDTDRAHAELERRLAEAAAAMTGVEVSTVLADDEPLQAVEDALRTFGADEVVVLTRGGQSELAQQAHRRFAVPVSQRALAPQL